MSTALPSSAPITEHLHSSTPAHCAEFPVPAGPACMFSTRRVHLSFDECLQYWPLRRQIDSHSPLATWSTASIPRNSKQTVGRPSGAAIASIQLSWMRRTGADVWMAFRRPKTRQFFPNLGFTFPRDHLSIPPHLPLPFPFFYNTMPL